MKKLLLLLPILAVTILAFSLAQFSEAKELEECRDGLIIVQLINAQSSTCKNIETAERWVELGIATITDPSYVKDAEAIIEEGITSGSITGMISSIPFRMDCAAGFTIGVISSSMIASTSLT